MSLLSKAVDIFRRILNRDPPQAPVVVPDTARQQLERYQAMFRVRATELASSLANGTMTTDEFSAYLSIEIHYLMVTAAAIGKGGFAALSADDLSLVGQQVEVQLNYLDRWMKAIKPPTGTNANYLRHRAAMYAGAATEVMNRFMVAALGAPELPFYPAQGTLCMTNCGCAWDIRKLDANNSWDCFWRRGKDDSCATCLRREEVCSPLRIRNGVVQAFDSRGT